MLVPKEGLRLVAFVNSPGSPMEYDGYNRAIRSLKVQGISVEVLPSGECILRFYMKLKPAQQH